MPLSFCSFILAFALALAQAPAAATPADALDGIDPVVLLTQGKEVSGKDAFTVQRGKFVYRFSTAETKTAFEKDPARYEIQLSGACARMGDARGNPSDYAVVDGKIYIFASDECHKKFVAAPAKYLDKPAPAISSTPDDVRRGRAVIDRAVAALGGAARVDAIDTFVEVSTQEMTRGDQHATFVQTRTWRLPGDVRLDMTVKQGERTMKMAMLLTSEGAWQMGMGRVMPMAPEAQATGSRDNARLLLPLLRRRNDAAVKVAASADGVVDGVKVRRARIIDGPADVTMNVDRGSGALHSLSYAGRNGQGEVGEITVVFGDFRDVSGLRLPFSERSLFNGATDPSLAPRRIDSLAINAPVDPAVFKPPAAPWPQWGGPHRNFSVPGLELATAWPASGPRRAWQRPLGDGFSSIVTDGAVLYTMYRDGAQDVVIALDARTGETRWSAKYDAPFKETCTEQLGPAPRAAPLIAGDRLITVSAGGLMNAFNRADGIRLWTVDLLGATRVRACGYSSSPLAYKNTIVTTAGGKGHAVVALDAATGKAVWQSQDFDNGYSSPILIDLDGRPELIVFTFGEVSGLDPDSGALEWTRPHPADQGVNVTTPLWSDDHTLFVTSAYNGGSRALKLARTAAGVAVDEVWSNKRVRVHFGNAVRIGGRIYASSGDTATAPFAAIEAATGEVAWRDRAVTRAALIAVGDRLLILDEDGNLVLAKPTDEGLQVQAKASILSERAWTAPTLSGTTLFVRDRHGIMALDLRK